MAPLFERGAKQVGTDYLGHLFWDKYLEFEIGRERYPHAASIYYRVLQIPLAQLDRYWERFQVFAQTRATWELLTAEEELAFQPPQAGEEAGLEDGEALPTGDALEAEKRERLMQAREMMYRAAAEERARRLPFEQAIKRPYFHFKALDDAQLTNWRKYLDFEEKEEDFARARKLYERCIIPCANYPEFWHRYGEWLDAAGERKEALEVYRRAATVFLRRRPEMLLTYAAEAEARGEPQRARETYERLGGAVAPGLVEGALRWASFERRQGRTAEAAAVYEAALERVMGEPRAHLFLASHAARFFLRHLKDVERARGALECALVRAPEMRAGWDALVELESALLPAPEAERQVRSVYERAVAPESSLSPEDKLDMWHRYLEFLHDSAASIATVHKATAAFKKARGDLVERRNAELSRKRALDAPADADERAKLARAAVPAAGAPTGAALPVLVGPPPPCLPVRARRAARAACAADGTGVAGAAAPVAAVAPTVGKQPVLTAAAVQAAAVAAAANIRPGAAVPPASAPYGAPAGTQYAQYAQPATASPQYTYR
eukprot:tig00020911_g15750.t1